MEVKILGAGCANCKLLQQRTMDALAELGVDADVEKVENPMEIARYGVLATPALVINGKVKVYGRVPATRQIADWIREEA